MICFETCHPSNPSDHMVLTNYLFPVGGIEEFRGFGDRYRLPLTHLQWSHFVTMTYTRQCIYSFSLLVSIGILILGCFRIWIVSLDLKVKLCTTHFVYVVFISSESCAKKNTYRDARTCFIFPRNNLEMGKTHFHSNWQIKYQIFNNDKKRFNAVDTVNGLVHSSHDDVLAYRSALMAIHGAYPKYTHFLLVLRYHSKGFIVQVECLFEVVLDAL